jgi:hypothetical protein
MGKYKTGDIVGVVADAMYEFEIVDDPGANQEDMYAGKCLTSYTQTIKIGEVRGIPSKNIMTKLGESGIKFPPIETYKRKKNK